MAWVRGGDTSATYPPVMKVVGLPGADERTVNEVMGFIVRLAFLSAAHTTDYLVDIGTVHLVGGSRTEVLLRLCKRAKLLTEVKVDGLRAFKIVEDPDFLHLRLKAELEWEAQQRADGKNEKLTIPVRLRDGDLCRYCGVMVQWRGRASQNSATFDHLNPGQPATVDTFVVACRGCNSGLRDVFGREHDQLHPAPSEPFYSDFTANWLTDRGHPTAATQRPDSQSDTAHPRARATRKRKDTAQATRNDADTARRQRPDSQSDTAPTQGKRPTTVDTAPNDSDPHTPQVSGPRAHEMQQENDFPRDREAIGTSSAGSGSGRVGSGNEPPFPATRSKPNPAGTRRRRRSARGTRPDRPTTGDTE